jgi:hypothetical protein
VSENGRETQQLLGIYRAVDSAVLSGEASPLAIGGLLPAYSLTAGEEEGESAAGWFDTVEEMARRATGIDTQETAFPELLESIRALADIEPRSRMRARRLLALAVAMRAFPELLGPEGSEGDLVRRALQVPGLARDEEGAAILQRLLADEDLLPNLDAWPEMIDAAVQQGVVGDAVALRSQPCSSEIVYVEIAGELEPVAQYTTSFCTTDVGLAAARGFLDPANWPGCTDLWCEMVPMGTAPDGTRRFLEIIGPDCAGDGWKLRTCLEVGTADLPDGGAVLSYRKCPDPAASDGQVTIDEGSVTVLPGPNGGVCVTTTKRLRFYVPFDGGGLVLLLCTFGWGTLAEDLILGCAYDGATPAASWPGSTGPAAKPKPKPMAVSGTASGGTPGSGGKAGGAEAGGGKAGGGKAGGGTSTAGSGTATSPNAELQGVFVDAAQATKDCIAECIDVAANAMAQILSGKYDVDAAVDDVAKSAQRAVRDVATAYDLAYRAMGSATAGRVPRRRPTPPRERRATDGH